MARLWSHTFPSTLYFTGMKPSGNLLLRHWERWHWMPRLQTRLPRPLSVGGPFLFASLMSFSDSVASAFQGFHLSTWRAMRPGRNRIYLQSSCSAFDRRYPESARAQERPITSTRHAAHGGLQSYPPNCHKGSSWGRQSCLSKDH
jgi:hypothetical protein